MYETQKGMGYSPVLQTRTFSDWWNGVTPEPKPCLERQPGGRMVCFQDTPSERELARTYDCVRTGQACNDNGAVGGVWCCPTMFFADHPTQPDSNNTEVVMEEEQVTVTPPPTTPPRPFSTHTVIGKLTHPGAILAMGLAVAGTFLLYREYGRSREVTI